MNEYDIGYPEKRRKRVVEEMNKTAKDAGTSKEDKETLEKGAKALEKMNPKNKDSN